MIKTYKNFSDFLEREKLNDDEFELFTNANKYNL